MFKIFIQILLFFFPWKIRRVFLCMIFGFKLHKSSKIGFSIILADKLYMYEDSKIGNFIFCKRINRLVLKKNSSLGNFNLITGFGNFKNSKVYFGHLKSRRCELVLGNHTRCTSRHFFDCNGGINIGDFTTIAGSGTQFLTHSIDLYNNRQDIEDIKIGDYCFIGTNSIILKGSKLPDYCVLGASSLLNKKFEKILHLYAGNPAKPVKNYDKFDLKYFNRTDGFVE